MLRCKRDADQRFDEVSAPTRARLGNWSAVVEPKAAPPVAPAMTIDARILPTAAPKPKVKALPFPTQFISATAPKPDPPAVPPPTPTKLAAEAWSVYLELV